MKHLSFTVALIGVLVGVQAQAQVTYNSTNFTFEAEDFNFGGGQFFNNIVLCQDFGGGTSGCYFDRVGWTNIDELEINFVTATNLDESVYRYGPVAFPRYEYVDTFLTSDSLVRTQYTAAGIPDYQVQSIVAGEWLNYSRTFPAGNYNIYMRVSSGNALSADLHKASNATTTNQTLTYLGRFATTGATTGYEFVPLTDFSGVNQVVVGFPGTTQTLRATANSAGYTPNFYMFVASTNSANLPPSVQITSPAPEAILSEGVATNIMATAIDAETSVTNVQFYAGTSEPLALIAATNAGPYTFSWTPPVLGSVNVYTIRVVATDATGLVGADEIQVTVRDPDIQTLNNTVGNGADVTVSEDGGVSGGSNGSTLGIRYNPTANNSLGAIRFDLTGVDVPKIDDVSVSVIEYRDSSSPKAMALYGIYSNATPTVGSFTADDWDESVVTFETMPGLDFDGDTSTLGPKPGQTMLLVDNIASSGVKGTKLVISGPAIAPFIRDHAGASNLVSFLLTRSGAASGTLNQMATKEASSLRDGSPSGVAGDFAPFLEFRILPTVPPEVTITNPVNAATLDGGVEVVIGVNATDSDGSVTNVDFYAGQAEPLTLLGSDTTAPYSMPWTPAAVNPVNLYNIRVVATDSDGVSTEDSISVTVVDATLTAVSTFDGSGSDVEMQERSDGGSTNFSQRAVNDPSLHTRTSSGGDRNEVVGLRFDLSSYTLSELNSVTFNMIAWRTDSSERVVNFYGVAQGTAGGTGTYTTETWTDTALDASNLYGDLPGLLVTDSDPSTQNINVGSTTYLGQLTIPSNTPEGNTVSFSDAALTTFIQAYSGGSNQVTLVLAAGSDSGGQWTFTSKEATQTDSGVLVGSAGDFAPYLSFTVGQAPSPELNYQVTGGGTAITFTWTGSAVLQSQTNTLSAGLGTNWVNYSGGGTSGVSVPVDKTKGAVFFRLLQAP